MPVASRERRTKRGPPGGTDTPARSAIDAPGRSAAEARGGAASGSSPTCARGSAANERAGEGEGSAGRIVSGERDEARPPATQPRRRGSADRPARNNLATASSESARDTRPLANARESLPQRHMRGASPDPRDHTADPRVRPVISPVTHLRGNSAHQPISLPASAAATKCGRPKRRWRGPPRATARANRSPRPPPRACRCKNRRLPEGLARGARVLRALPRTCGRARHERDRGPRIGHTPCQPPHVGWGGKVDAVHVGGQQRPRRRRTGRNRGASPRVVGNCARMAPSLQA